MERMKVEIDSEELKRLKSREEKYLAYMDMLSYRGEDKTYVDALCGKVAKLEEENKKLNIKVASLEGEIKGLNYTIDKLREELSAYDREYFDEDKKAKNIFIDKSGKVIKGGEFTTLC